jgi:two-component sensor histidine kinase
VFVATARAGKTDEGEWTYVRKDGTTFPVLLSVTALRGLSGEITGFLGIAVDISERKQREQEVQAALREKETLLKEVYHRVKNNLQVVMSLFNLQLRALPDGPARESLLEGAARVRAMALVHEKLYQSANLSSIQLGSYVGDLCQQLAAAAAAKPRGIALALELDRVDAGPELAVPLGLLLNELVSNSLKHGFSAGRGGTIHVALRHESPQRARLEVWDDGAGFAEGSTEEGTTRSLGLRLVRTLSRQIDGELTLENRGGAYASLSFALDIPHQSRKVA